MGQDLLNVLQTDVARITEIEGLDAQLVLDRHDEVIYHVANQHLGRFCELLQESHEFAMSSLLCRLGFETAVDQWMRFGSVDVLDHYCEEATICTTPNQWD